MITASCSKWPSISPQEKNVEDSGLWSVIRYHRNYNINYLSQATDPQRKIRTKHGLTKHLLVGSINLESLLHSIYTFKVSCILVQQYISLHSIYTVYVRYVYTYIPIQKKNFRHVFAIQSEACIKSSFMVLTYLCLCSFYKYIHCVSIIVYNYEKD